MNAGFADEDITPPDGRWDLSILGMAGAVLHRVPRGVDEPLLARAAVLEEDGTRVALVACDLIAVTREMSERLEELVRPLGLAREGLLLHGTHSHSGPDVRGQAPEQAEYARWAAERCAAADERALQQAETVRVAAGAGHEAEIAANSRVLLADGTVGWTGFTPEETVGWTGPIDPRVGFVHFTRPAGGAVGTLLNYSLHSTIPAAQPKRGYWPGYPGRTCLEVEARLGGEAAFFTGACGNIHNLRTHTAEQAATRLAAAVARSVSLARAEVRDGPFRLRAGRRTLRIPKRRYDGREIDRIRHVLAVRGPVSETLIGGFEQRLADARDAYPSGVVELDVQAIAFGDVCVVAVPGELFVEFGIEIKAKSPFRHTYVVELAHEYISYIPTPHALVMGGYQTWTGVLCHPSAGQMVVDGALELVRALSG
jgi:neutral ceramidase